MGHKGFPPEAFLLGNTHQQTRKAKKAKTRPQFHPSLAYLVDGRKVTGRRLRLRYRATPTAAAGGGGGGGRWGGDG